MLRNTPCLKKGAVPNHMPDGRSWLGSNGGQQREGSQATIDHIEDAEEPHESERSKVDKLYIEIIKSWKNGRHLWKTMEAKGEDGGTCQPIKQGKTFL